MTTKLAGAVAAGALAAGILVGAVGIVLVHDATRSAMGRDEMRQTMTMMGGSMMGDGFGDIAEVHACTTEVTHERPWDPRSRNRPP